jgi:hypothetical protein
MIRNFLIHAKGCGDQRPQETNGASPKSQMSRENHLTSEKGADKKQMSMRNLVIASLAIVLFSATLVSCKKTRICECTVTASVMGYTSSQTVSGEYEGKCSELENDFTAAKGMADLAQAMSILESYGGSVNLSCHEKK